MGVLIRAALLVGLSCGCPALAQAPRPIPVVDPEIAASQATILKLNAYVGLLNRTLRATESLTRYGSWVDLNKGPTGRERIIYGLYSLYDVRTEIAKAEAATSAPPAMPELDAEMKRYIAAYGELAPTITAANAYYERQDYKVDAMAEGKMLHAKLAVAGPAFQAARDRIDPLFSREKAKSDAAELALIERREGRKARWQVTNVMIQARQVVDRLPAANRPKIDQVAFDAALSDFGAAVKEMDAYSAANPNSFHVFEGQPRSLLGKLRDFRDKIVQAKGDARRSGGNDLTWIVSGYNMMVSTSDDALAFSR